MKFFLNAQPFGATRADFESGVTMAGSDPERFARTLELTLETARMADEGGFEGICFSEQHANVEGLPEVTTNPILFDAALAAQTKRLKVGQLGLTLSAHHPLRVAEDLAMLDHMTNGRMFCGFTRGNATRWVNTLGLPFGTTIAQSDKSAADERNLRAIQEAWQIIKLAWTNPTFSYEGEFWTIPAPDTHWGYDVTATYGQGMDADGRLREIGIVPRPLQQPFPRVFTPLAFRMTTALFWIGEGATAVCYASKDEFLKTAWDVLGERAETAGHPREAPVLAPAAFLLVGKDHAEVDTLREDYDWLMRTVYSVPPFNVPAGRMLIGTADEVSRQIEELSAVIPFEEMFVWHNIGLHDPAVASSSLEIFMERVMPRFGATAAAVS
jgi:alkanesulfonate monooxygenase SsuD/methylene tetrahydromethanopterin reductase-like flavin-dependent oxidoreductase (luciferase family)